MNEELNNNNGIIKESRREENEKTINGSKNLLGGDETDED